MHNLEFVIIRVYNTVVIEKEASQYVTVMEEQELEICFKDDGGVPDSCYHS